MGPGDGLLVASQPGKRGGCDRASDIRGRAQRYLGGMPPDVAARIPAESWEEDWRVMQLPGRMDTQRALVRDYGNYVARFDEIAAISRALAAAFPDALGTPRPLLRSRRGPVMDAGAAEDGSPCSRRRPQAARDARGRGRAAHARLHQARRAGGRGRAQSQSKESS